MLNKENKKIIAIFLCLFTILLPNTVLANGNGKVTGLKKGDSAPYEGVLFDPNTAARLLADKENQKDECQLEINSQIEKTKARHKMEMDNAKIAHDMVERRYSSIVHINNKEIERLLKIALERRNEYSPLWFAGGVVAGIATSIAIFYAAVETAK